MGDPFREFKVAFKNTQTEKCKAMEAIKQTDPWAEIIPNKTKMWQKVPIAETNGRISGLGDRLFENTQMRGKYNEENLWEILDSIRTSVSDWTLSRAWKCPKGRKLIKRSNTQNFSNLEKDKKYLSMGRPNLASPI